MTEMTTLLNQWTAATGDLKYGVQRVFHDVFSLAAEGKTHLIYGADYYNGMPCLVNTVGGMLSTGGGEGIPSEYFGEVVRLFDEINREFERTGINTESHRVSETAAETLLRNFAPLKDVPPAPMHFNPDATVNEQYIEPSDDAMAAAMVAIFTMESRVTETIPDVLSDLDSEFAVGRYVKSDNND